MSVDENRQVDREMTRGLCVALEPVIAGRRDALVMDAARNVSQLLVLPGLDRLLAVLAERGRGAEPAELRHAIGRLRRERDRALAQSSLVPFYESDRELAALASHLEGVEWTGSPAAPAPPARHEPVLTLTHALGGARYATDAAAATASRVRLTAPVAAVLRAALDWLMGGAGERALPRITEDAGTLEVECRGVDPSGLLPAHEVIAAVGGCLGPAPGAERGTWALRLPAVTEREFFLMFEQDELSLALPWSNVLRIQLETPEGEPLPAPPLAPLTPLTGARRGRPVVTVGLGLRRGSLAVDRLVWRLPADPVETDTPAPEGASRAVRSDEGEVFWVVDVAKLMRDVPLPDVSAPPRSTAPPRAPRTAPAPATPRPDVPLALIHLRPEHVEPIDAAPAREAGAGDTPAPAPAPPAPTGSTAPATARTVPASPAQEAPVAPAPSAPTAPGAAPRAHARTVPVPPAAATEPANAPSAPADPAPAGGHARRAIIAEDSFMARIFLMRLLQAQGYDVHSVGTAQELRGALSSGPWTLVCVDVGLPDAHGAEWIREVSESQLDQPEPAVVVALVRDGADAGEAAAGGVHRCLLKPFAQDSVARMLERAGLPAAGSR